VTVVADYYISHPCQTADFNSVHRDIR